MIERLQAEYPGFDVRQQIRMMQLWWEANPRKRKEPKGEYRFVIGWLNKEYAKACAVKFKPQEPVYTDKNGSKYIITPERFRQYL